MTLTCAPPVFGRSITFNLNLTYYAYSVSLQYESLMKLSETRESLIFSFIIFDYGEKPFTITLQVVNKRENITNSIIMLNVNATVLKFE